MNKARPHTQCLGFQSDRIGLDHSATKHMPDRASAAVGDLKEIFPMARNNAFDRTTEESLYWLFW